MEINAAASEGVQWAGSRYKSKIILRPLQVVIRFLVHRPHPFSRKLILCHYYSVCIAHAHTVELWLVPCGLVCSNCQYA